MKRFFGIQAIALTFVGAITHLQGRQLHNEWAAYLLLGVYIIGSLMTGD